MNWYLAFWERKRFFFEKKNQKNFAPAGCGDTDATARRSKSFFASFFSKKEALAAFTLFACRAAARREGFYVAADKADL